MIIGEKSFVAFMLDNANFTPIISDVVPLSVGKIFWILFRAPMAPPDV